MSDELPKGWTYSTLGEVCSKPQYGWTCSASKKGKIKYLRTTDISHGDIDWSSVPYCEEVPEDVEKYRVRSDDILVSRAGSVGNSYRLQEVPLDTVFASYLIRFNPLEGVEPKFIESYLKSENYWRAISEFTAGIAIPNVNASKLASLEIPLAPLSEQRRIVAKLEKLLDKVNASQKRLERIPKILKRFRQSILAAACSGKLTEDWREENGNGGLPASFPRLESDETLPEKWIWCSFGNYVENLDGKRVPIASKNREMRRGKYPYYGASGIIDSIDDYTHDGVFVLIGEDGANLLSRSTPIAFLANGKIWVNNHAHVLRCKEGFPNVYLSFYINSIDLSPYVTGTAQPKLNQTNMNTIPVPVPPLSEQQEIVRRVEAMFALADQIEARYTKAKAHVAKLTQSILYRPEKALH